MRIKKRWMAVGTAGALALCLLVWRGAQAGSAAPRPGESDARPVPTAVVKPVPATMTRDFPALVRARRRVELAFTVSGLLVELNAQEGRVVRKGEVIGKLDPRDYQNALDSVRASWADARQDYERIKALLDRNGVSAADFDRAKATFEKASAEMRIREKALADTVLCAPFDGIVAKRYVENHEHIQATEPAVSVQDIGLLEVVFQVPERLVSRGGGDALKNISVRLDADGKDWHPARLLEFSVQADAVTRTYETVLGMEPPRDIRILPGMTATVRAEVGQAAVEDRTGWCLVPPEAVVIGSDGLAYVWVIADGEGSPRRVQVEKGAIRGAGLEIRAGLAPGQRVAVAGLSALTETMRVRPMADGAEGLDG